MSNILVTAIGSMSAPVVLDALAQQKHKIIGTDIYPQGWQANLKYISAFYQVVKATSQTYINELLLICGANNIEYIIPLTDPEVDILSENRQRFADKGIILCISNEVAISKCRDKVSIESIFTNVADIYVIPSISTQCIENDDVYPIIAKPRKGRSSEGLFLLKHKKWLHLIEHQDDYVFQPYIQGEVFTVDVIRDQYGNTVSIPRKELIRTSNGAGLTVDIRKNKDLENAVKIIADKLDILGCINIEFLFDGATYFLMDVNPRFSAGVGFSVSAGYNFVLNHLNCFQGLKIPDINSIKDGILSRSSQIIYIN